jgi:hypothetical protein
MEFAPGSAVLDGAAQQKVTALRKALVERPGLNLDIPSTLDPAADHRAIADERWARAISPVGASGDRAAYLDRLKQLHLERLSSKPDIPNAPKPAEGETAPDPVENAIAILEPLVRGTIVVDEAELAALGTARAEAVRELLLYGPHAADPQVTSQGIRSRC